MHGQQQPGNRDPRSCCSESLEQRPPLMSWNADSASWWRQLRVWCCGRGTQVLCRWETGRRGTATWRWSVPESEANGVHGVAASRDQTSGYWIQSEQQRGGRTAADSYLLMWQVRRRSAAERAGVRVGDLVLAINDVSTVNLTHQSMLDHIGHQQLTLTLTLSRYGACQSISISWLNFPWKIKMKN